jgi:hypothetical protein
MAYAKVQSNVATIGFLFSDSTQTVTLAAPATASNLIVVVVRAADETVTFNTPTDNAGSTYTLAGSVTHVDAGLLQRVLIWFAVAASGAQAVTCTTSANFSRNAEMIVAEFSGNATASVQDGSAVTNTGDGGATSHSPSSNITTTTADALLVGGSSDDDSGETYTQDAAYTLLDAGQSTAHGVFGYRIVSSIGTYGMTNTSTDFTDAVSLLVALKGAGGGPTSIVMNLQIG